MKLTKYGHACVALEYNGQRIVIDPGGLTPSFGPVQEITAVVVTHSHFDHFNIETITSIIQANPNVRIFTTQTVANAIKLPHIVVMKPGERASVGSFTLFAFGGKHAYVNGNQPQEENIGMYVDGFYYPGDSFTIPSGVTVTALALPVSAPWLKLGESLSFLAVVRPTVCIPTHNAVLSDVGQQVTDSWVSRECQDLGISYASLKEGESIEIQRVG